MTHVLRAAMRYIVLTIPQQRKYIPSPTLKLGSWRPAMVAVTPLVAAEAGAKDAATPNAGELIIAYEVQNPPTVGVNYRECGDYRIDQPNVPNTTQGNVLPMIHSMIAAR
jgi:hypothetical protein